MADSPARVRLHGTATGRAGFNAQLSQKRFSETPDVPVKINRAAHGDATVGELFAKVTQTVPSMNQVRRVAQDQETVSLTETDANGTLFHLIGVSGSRQSTSALHQRPMSARDDLAGHAQSCDRDPTTS
jgi:hypothetical protein